MPRAVLACLSLSFSLSIVGSAAATTLVHLDTRALVRESSDIVIGRVEGTRSYWNPAHTRILTDVTVRVTRRLEGAPAERITLTQLGGEVDGYRTTIPGGPLFRVDEEALLFVWRDRGGRAQVNGLAQGKFEIARDAASGAAFVQRRAPGMAVRDARSLAALPEGEPAPRLPLGDLVREIERALVDRGR